MEYYFPDKRQCAELFGGMRSSWLYFATRSLRLGAPVDLAGVQCDRRSAIVVSSVSPERWEVTAV